ncbi:MAG: 50S ribosomal protein L10 [Candidatus Pacebacteria bacterium]|nr:50S ribosomal protein L10 [Candidatus Paceibacterota bacterium]
MALTKDKKKEILDSISESIKKASAMVFVNFHGMKVSDVNEFRSKLKGEGVNYMVTKKTLAKKSFGDSKIEGEMPELVGELGIAYTEGDMTAPAREVYDFQEKLEGAVSIIGGVFEGRYVDKEGMVEIAQIPGIKTLQAQFVNIINSPIQGLAIALDAVAQKKESNS